MVNQIGVCLQTESLSKVNMENILIVSLIQIIIEYINLLILFNENEINKLNNDINHLMKMIEIIKLMRERSEMKRRIWSLEKNSGYWEVIVPGMTERIFKDNMRMDRKTFHYILSIVGKDMTTQDNNFRTATGTGKKLAVALTVLATNCEYRQVGHMYGIGKSSVHVYFKQFINSANNNLVKLHIKLPSSEEFRRISEDFEQRWQYPMAIGCIDGSHFPIEPPKEQAQDYFNYKGWHSMIALAICDANYKVYWVKSGIPGRCNDSGAFNKTNLYRKFENNEVLPEFSRKFNETDVGLHLLGDSAFQLKPWLIKTYRFSDSMTSEEIVFNKRHSRARRVIENVFGRCKARWRRLRKKMEFKLEDISKIIVVSFALNNICEENNFHIDINANDGDVALIQPRSMISDRSVDQISLNQRDALKDYFNSQHFQVE